MEKIKIQDKEFEILSINQRGPLLLVEFQEVQAIHNEELSEIVVLTAGGVPCVTLVGYTTIYKNEGNVVILSNDGSVYTEPDPQPVIEPYVPSEEDLERQVTQQEIENLKRELEATDYKVIKCSEYQLATLEAPYDIADLHTARQLLRDRINALETSLN